MGINPFPLTLRAVLLFEKLTARSFASFDIKDGENIPELIYCLQRCESGGSSMPFDTWCSVLDSEEVALSLLSRLECTLENLAPLTPSVNSEGQDDDSEGLDFTTIASMIIVEGGVDASYVMDRMELWEIPAILNAIHNRKKETLEYKRLFSWMVMLPHISKESACSPEKLLPFPWEVEVKDSGQEIFELLKDAKIVVAEKP